MVALAMGGYCVAYFKNKQTITEIDTRERLRKERDTQQRHKRDAERGDEMLRLSQIAANGYEKRSREQED